jgi:hypothetical protein
LICRVRGHCEITRSAVILVLGEIFRVIRSGVGGIRDVIFGVRVITLIGYKIIKASMKSGIESKMTFINTCQIIICIVKFEFRFGFRIDRDSDDRLVSLKVTVKFRVPSASSPGLACKPGGHAIVVITSNG